MSEPAHIRDATEADAPAISALIHTLTAYFLADAEDPGSAEGFFKTITVEAVRGYLRDDRYRYHLAETAAGSLAGVVGVRDTTHLYHLFIDQRFHGRGLGGRLWAAAKDAARRAGNPGQFTVNSSRYGVPIYTRFGFVATGPEVVKEGIAFIPMELDERQPN